MSIDQLGNNLHLKNIMTSNSLAQYILPFICIKNYFSNGLKGFSPMYL